MPFMEWDDALNLGEPTLDRQHRGLVDLINQVSEAIESPDRDTEIMHSLTSMYLYARQHFFDEEAFMERAGYPRREQHAAQHKLFIEKAQHFTDACLDDSMHDTDLLEFLVSWIQEHVRHEDARIMRFVNGKDPG